jgi:Holliday junction resolvase RusA-like endonuclease
MQIIIPLPPITKKNSQRIVINKKTNRPMIIPSKPYKQYEQDCSYFIKPQNTIDYPVNVKCLYYMPTRRRVDLTNLMEATHDILVKYKVLEDDNSNVIVSVDGSRVLYDKENPRTEVYITKV